MKKWLRKSHTRCDLFLITLRQKKYPCALQCVPDWFVMQERIDLWGDDDCNDKIFEWYNGYKKRKVQKVSIKEELMPNAWHPLRYWD